VVNNPDSSRSALQIAAKKLASLDADGYPISKVWIQYPRLCEEAVRRGLLL